MRIDLMGLPVDALTLPETVERVARIVAEGRPRQQMSLNAAKVVQACVDEELRAAIRNSEIVNADGAAVVYASRVLGKPLPQRVAGCDLMMELLRQAPQRGWRPYFLGARKSVVERVVQVSRRRWPDIDIAGWRDGFFRPEDEEDVAEEIAESKAHLLFVALPSPRKELFCARFLDRMNVPFCMGVGGSFDVLAGELERAPVWMRENGLEWAHRLVLEPRRMWRRAVLDSARFTWLVMQARAGFFRVP
jgi:N-acetylglucosaminyldiphosphoundecaprenol N-acetyl-beta-D-mannosaminyltransferase